MDGIKKIFGRKKTMFNLDGIENIELVDNKKLNEAIVLLEELYSHMYERIGVPNVVKGEGMWGAEGATHIHLSIMIPPFDEYRKIVKENKKIVQVVMNTGVLARRDPNVKIQPFANMDLFYDQVKRWHKYEMSLSLDDKNADYYIDTDH